MVTGIVVSGGKPGTNLNRFLPLLIFESEQSFLQH